MPPCSISTATTSRVSTTAMATRRATPCSSPLVNALRAPEDAVRIAEHILNAMATPVCLADGTTIFAPLSIGLAVYPLHARNGTALLHSADAAMYGAKRQSGATWHSAESAPP